MSRITGREVASLMEAYTAVYNPDLREELIFEEFLTEEFILEAYQYVADFLVSEGYVPGYETAELFMSEMDETWIDEILCDYGLYLNEGPFGNFANTVIGGAKRAAGAVAGGVRKVAGAADRGVAGAVRAGQAIKGTAQRAAGAVARGATAAGQAVAGGAVRAGQTVAGAAQRAGGAAVRAATPVAQAVKGTAQRAVAAGQSALGGAARAVQGAGQAAVGGAVRAGQAVAGGVQRAGQAVAGAAQGAARKIGQEIEISRKVGAGEPLGKPAAGAGAAARKVGPAVSGAAAPAARPAASAAARPAASAAARPAAAAPAARPAAAAPAARPAAPAGAMNKPAAPVKTTVDGSAAGKPAPAAAPKKQSLASQAAELRQMAAASRARQGITAGYEPQGEDIQEIPLVVAAPLVAGGLYAAGKGMEALKSKADSAINKARKTSAIGGDRRVPQMNSYDMFDAVLEYLVAEGYADTNQDALKIMANMTEEERTAVIEQAKFTVTALDKKLNTPAYKRFKEGNPAYQAGGEGANKLVKGV